MSSFEIVGGNRLKGEIIPQGAKNEALQVICATLLTSEKVVIENVPNIRDVNKLIELLQLLNVKVEKLGVDVYQFQADAVDLAQLPLGGEQSAFRQRAVHDLLCQCVGQFYIEMITGSCHVSSLPFFLLC